MEFKNIKCMLCGDEKNLIQKKIYLGSDNITNLVKCEKCDLSYLSPQPNAKFLDDCYDFLYSSKKSSFPSLTRREQELLLAKDAQKRYEMSLSHIKKVIGASLGLSLLDYGCGLGLFIRLARTSGFKTYGIDISKDAVAFVREKFNLNVYSTEEKQLSDFPTSSLNVITLFHVLEHLPDPLSFLKECHKSIDSNGVMVVAVPNNNSIFERGIRILNKIRSFFFGKTLCNNEFLSRSFDGWVEVVESNSNNKLLESEFIIRNFHHLYFFTPKSLKELFVKAGFGEIYVYAGYVQPAKSIIKKVFKNRFVNWLFSLFGMQEELFFIAKKTN